MTGIQIKFLKKLLKLNNNKINSSSFKKNFWSKDLLGVLPKVDTQMTIAHIEEYLILLAIQKNEK